MFSVSAFDQARAGDLLIVSRARGQLRRGANGADRDPARGDHVVTGRRKHRDGYHQQADEQYAISHDWVLSLEVAWALAHVEVMRGLKPHATQSDLFICPVRFGQSARRSFRRSGHHGKRQNAIVVCDDDHDAIFTRIATWRNELHHRLARLSVEQHPSAPASQTSNRGSLTKRTRNGHALLLAAGELRGKRVGDPDLPGRFPPAIRGPARIAVRFAVRRAPVMALRHFPRP